MGLKVTSERKSNFQRKRRVVAELERSGGESVRVQLVWPSPLKYRSGPQNLVIYYGPISVKLFFQYHNPLKSGHIKQVTKKWKGVFSEVNALSKCVPCDFR